MTSSEDVLKTVLDHAKRIPLYFLGSAFLATVVSYVTFQALIGSNFDSIHKRIDDQSQYTRDSFSRVEDALANLRFEANENASEIKALLQQLDEDILFIREFATEVRGLEDPIAYGPEILQVYPGTIPMGGSGEVPIPNFPTYTIEIPFDASQEELRAEANRVKLLLRRALETDRRYDFDSDKHQIEVSEYIIQHLGDPEPKIGLVAIAYFTDSGDE